MNEQVINYIVAFLFLIAAIISFIFPIIEKVSKSDKQICLISSVSCLVMSIMIIYATATN